MKENPKITQQDIQRALRKFEQQGRLMRKLDAIPYHVWGAHINRETVLNLRAAEFARVGNVNLLSDIVKRIEAYAPNDAATNADC